MTRPFVLAVLLALVATACGSETPDTLALGEDVAPEVSSETVLRLATSDPRPLLAGVAEWERSHPTARVEIEVREPDDLGRSVLSGAEDVSFDVVALDALLRHGARENPERFIDLADFASPAERLRHPDDYVEAGLGSNDQLFGLPLYTDSLALAVRTDILDGEDIASLRRAQDWCEVLLIANDFALETQNAFFASATDVARALLAQSGDSLVPADGEANGPVESLSLEEIWDLSTATLGLDPLHPGTCEGQDDFGAMSRNLRFADEVWTEAASAGGFAATVLRYGELEELAVSIPETAGNWEIIDLPGVGGTTGDLTHLGVVSTSEHVALAFDLVATLVSPESQHHAFVEGSPGLPTATELTQSDLLTEVQSDFFGDGAIVAFADAQADRPIITDSLERQIIIDETLAAIDRVGGGEQSSLDAWQELLANIDIDSTS